MSMLMSFSSLSSGFLCSVGMRVADMVGRMTIQEKIANLDTEAPAIASLGLNAYKYGGLTPCLCCTAVLWWHPCVVAIDVNIHLVNLDSSCLIIPRDCGDARRLQTAIPHAVLATHARPAMPGPFAFAFAMLSTVVLY